MRIVILSVVLALAACSTTEPSKRAPETDRSDTPGAEIPPPPPPPPAPVRSLPASDAEDVIEAPVIEESVTTRAMTRVPARRTEGSGYTPPKNIKDFLPFIDVAMDPGAANSNDYAALPLEDHYTRIRIKTLTPKATDMAGTASGKYTAKKKPDRDYKKESRGWLARQFSSQSVSRTLLAEFELSKPDVRATEALFAASFTSNRQDGESWSTDQSLAVYATPWFKVSSNTTLTAKMRMQLADKRESTGASASFLGTLTNAATLIAPSASMITYFSAPAMTQSSNFLDSSVSSLFGRAITEQSSGSMPLKTWEAGRPILVVSAAMPHPKDIRRTTKTEVLGTWEVYLEPPIASMFTSLQYVYSDGLQPDYTGVTEADILGFKIGNELTVYDYIFSRLDLSDRIAALNETGDAQLARLICNRIDRGLSEIGFNSWDSAIGVWAAARSDQMTSVAADALTQSEACPAMERLAQL